MLRPGRQPVYTRCLFCNQLLGQNRLLEQLPIGRRLAFDESRGRLWVICPHCARWNLTPIDERWEAIEACERAFRTSPLRASSSNIGLAQLPEGVQLVRIGRPLPTEFAAWRYGRHFLARHRRRALAVVGAGALLGLAPAAGLVAGAAGAWAVATGAGLSAAALWRRDDVVIPFRGSRQLRVNLHQLQNAALVKDESAPDGWALVCHHRRLPRPVVVSVRDVLPPGKQITLTGAQARAAAALLLPRLNRLGGDPATVQEAARWVQAAGGPARAFHTMARSTHGRPPLRTHDGTLATLHDPARLALEMAVHEDEEQRYLNGELSVLAWIWRREERLASIADGLGLPGWVEEHLARLRARKAAV